MAGGKQTGVEQNSSKDCQNTSENRQNALYESAVRDGTDSLRDTMDPFVYDAKWLLRDWADSALI